MAQKFKYHDGSIDYAKWLIHDGVSISPQCFAGPKPLETEADWIARIFMEHGIRPVKYEAPTHDPNTQDKGEAVETIDPDGYAVISFPNPVDKTPCWNKDTKEVMYLSQGQTFPSTYTLLEPSGDQAEVWDGTSWAIDFNLAVDLKVFEISSVAENLMESLATEYGPMERATWDQQYDEALEYEADPNADVPLLDSIAASRGMTVSDLVQRIKNNRTAWVQLSGGIVGQRLAYQDLVDAAIDLHGTDPGQALIDLQGITVNYPPRS